MHAHYVTDRYLTAAMECRSPEAPTVCRVGLGSSVVDELAMMDRQGIGRAVLSISSPGVHFGERPFGPQTGSRSQRLRRLMWWRTIPDRFGLFASLPLPDLEGRTGRGQHEPSTIWGPMGVIIETNSGQALRE